jgi:hypothetical protein
MTRYYDLKNQAATLNAELEFLSGRNKVDLQKERQLVALQVDLASAKREHAEQMRQALRKRFGEWHRYVEYYIGEANWEHGGDDYWADFETEDELFEDFKVFMKTLIDVEVS